MLASGVMENARLRLVPLALLLVAAPLAAAPIGRIKVSQGTVRILRNGTALPAPVGAELLEKDAVETGADGLVGYTFTDGTTFSTGPKSRVDLSSYSFDSKSVKGSLLAKMKRGSLSVTTGEITKSTPGAVKIETPSSILGVRGTHFLVSVEDGE